MKKILLLLLVLSLSLTVFVGCDQLRDVPVIGPVVDKLFPPEVDPDPEEPVANLDAALSFIRGMYENKDGGAKSVTANFDVVKSVIVDDFNHTVTWASDNTNVVVGDHANDSNLLTVYVANVVRGTEPISFTLTATISDNAGGTKQVSFEYVIPALPTKVPQDITSAADIEEGVAYKFYVYNATVGKTLYLDEGFAATYYFATTENSEEAVDVYAVKVDGGFKLYYNADGVAKYIAIEISGTHYNLKLKESADDAAVLAFNDEYDAFIITASDGEQLFLGNYNDKTTISASKIKFLGSDTNYVCHLATMIDSSTITDENKVAVEKENLNLDLGTITMDRVIDLAAMGNIYKDVAITWESNHASAVVTSASQLQITVGSAAYEVTLTATLKCGDVVEIKTFTVSVARKSALEITDALPPVADTAYKLYLTQANLGQILYFNGKLSGSYLGTSTNLADAVDVKLVAVTGGYHISFVDAAGATKYIDATSEGKATVVDTPANVFVWDSDLKVLKVTVGETDYYLGTHQTYNTISLSSTYYISGNNAANVGVSQFVANFATVTCTHYYDADCDTACNDCGTTRETTVEHTYDHACDEDCNLCGATRETEHVYDDANDATCNTEGCGHVRSLTYQAVNALPPVAGTAYTLYIAQNKLNQILYFDGGVNSSGYLTTSTDLSKAVKVTVVAVDGVEGGYYISFVDSTGATKYIQPKTSTSSTSDVEIVDTATAVYTWDATLNVFTTTVDTKIFYLGTYNTYNTLSFSETYRISGDNASAVGVSQFVATFATITCTHEYSVDCDTVCNFCFATREVTAQHTWANVCDTECDACGLTREVEHVFDNSCDTICNTEGCTGTQSITHKDENSDNLCDNCNADLSQVVEGPLATFDFGANVTTTGAASDHSDGDEITAGKEYTSGSYTLTISSCSKAYDGANDVKGTSALKLGTGSAVGSITFTVDANVSTVKIYVAAYKLNNTKITINGGDEISISTTDYSSNDGNYMMIEIDTSSVKTVTIATVSGATRVMIDKIEFCS